MSALRALIVVFDKAIAEAPAGAEQVVARTALAIEATAKTLAPVRTGALRASITSEVNGTHGEVFSDLSYSYFVEAGTSKMAGQPYLGPAADRHTPEFADAMEQLGGRLLD
jgi:HK97 gp10 family phage protein